MQSSQHDSHLRGARPDNRRRIDSRSILGQPGDQAVLENGLGHRDEQRAAQRLEEHDGRRADGDILGRQDRLHGRHGNLEAGADACAQDDLVADPLARGDVDLVHGDETGSDGGDGSAADQERRVVARDGDGAAHDHRGHDGGQHQGQELDAGFHGGGALDALEEDGQVVDEDEEGPAEEQSKHRGGEDGAVLEHARWQGGLVTHLDLRECKEDSHEAEPDEQADDPRVVPRVLVTSPLQGEQEADDSGDKQTSTDEVQLLDPLKDGSAGELVLVGESENKQDNG